MMRHCLYSLFLLLSFMLCACSSEESSWPNLKTEMVVAYTNAEGNIEKIHTDDGMMLLVKNKISSDFKNDSVRCLCQYVEEAEGVATIYEAKMVTILSQLSRKHLKQDPTGVQSVWVSPSYINFHLYPKTKGGKQAWAFVKDSTKNNIAGGKNYYLSLHHQQLNDTAAFSTHFYAAIHLDSVALLRNNKDTVLLSIQTFEEKKIWQLPL